MKQIKLLIIIFVCLLVSCGHQQNLQYTYNSNPNYTWGYAEFFGAYYADYGNANNVISLSLFSDSLSIDSTGSLIGIGQYLFLEDIFIAKTDTLLPTGTYTINSTGLPFTVTPGKNDTVDDQVYPIGAYISYYEENTTKSTLKIITEGTFTVSVQGLNYTIMCDFKTADSSVLKGRFTAKLPYYDEVFSTQKNAVRKRLLYNYK